MLTVAMKEKGFSMQEAADYVGDEVALRMNQFIADQEELPSFGEAVDKDVRKYIFSISQWQVGNMIWSFLTSRYFGAEKDKVKKTLIVNVKDYGGAPTPARVSSGLNNESIQVQNSI